MDVDLTPADLAGLPDAWVDALRDTATRGRTQELTSLVEQIEAEHPSLARRLQAMVDAYQFRQVVALTSHERST